MSVQQGDLHDDAVVREAFDEGVGFIAFQEIAIVVVGVMVHVNHGRVDIAHSVAKQIDSHHGECVLVFAVFDNVLLSAVLRTEVLSEAQRLRFQPGFLQFDKHQMLVTIVFAYSGGEVNAKHGDAIARGVDILVRTLLYLHHSLFQEGREYGAGDALVLHEVFEYRVVYGVCKV